MRPARALLLSCAALAVGAAEARNRLWLVNDAGETILSIRVSPSRDRGEGAEALRPPGLIAGRQARVVPGFADCRLDLDVRYASGHRETRRGVNACALTTVAFGARGAKDTPARTPSPRGGDPSFGFVNESGQTIRDLFVSPSTDADWGPERLGSVVLAPGAARRVELARGGPCHSDLRVVYMDGRVAERREIDTCGTDAVLWR